MDSESTRSGGYSPGRRRVIALAGAGGLAGLTAAIWPWKQPVGEVPVKAVPASPSKTEVSTAEEVPAAPSPVVSDSSVSLERERFTQHVGEVFRATAEGAGAIDLILESVGPLIAMSGENNRRFEGYSLLFKGPSGTVPGDGMCRLNHGTLGDTDLYLGAVGGVAGQPHCEAVISRAV
jgi:hypothetical protein